MTSGHAFRASEINWSLYKPLHARHNCIVSLLSRLFDAELKRVDDIETDVEKRLRAGAHGGGTDAAHRLRAS